MSQSGFVELTGSTDIAAVSNTDLGNPLAYIYQLGFGSKGALGVWILM